MSDPKNLPWKTTSATKTTTPIRKIGKGISSGRKLVRPRAMATKGSAQGRKPSRFLSVLAEYDKAKDVTRKRLYLETLERVLKDSNKVILEGGTGGSGVVPYLPLNELQRGSATPRSNQETGK